MTRDSDIMEPVVGEGWLNGNAHIGWPDVVRMVGKEVGRFEVDITVDAGPFGTWDEFLGEKKYGVL